MIIAILTTYRKNISYKFVYAKFYNFCFESEKNPINRYCLDNGNFTTTDRIINMNTDRN